MLTFIKKEPVLCISGILAFLSCFFVTPDKTYLSYINWRTLILLFSLMSVVSGASHAGTFHYISGKLTSGIASVRKLSLVFTLLCFFLSMFITNDVALVTVVPLTLLTMYHVSSRDLIFALVQETIAANLGSMLMPFGNPQNLFLSSFYGIGMKDFVLLMLPYTVLSLLLLLLQTFLVHNVPITSGNNTTELHPLDTRSLMLYILLFLISLLSIAHILDEKILLLIILVAIGGYNRRIFRDVNYSLLLTFLFFFVLIGNLGRMETIRNLLIQMLSGREQLTSVISSQFISNVPAAILLSGFTDQGRALIIGTNLGGLGTLIASMASLITYQLYAADQKAQPGYYLLIFTLLNVADLAILMLASFMI